MLWPDCEASDELGVKIVDSRLRSSSLAEELVVCVVDLVVGRDPVD
jgi:hypothetical protein